MIRQPDPQLIRKELARKSLADFLRLSWRYIDPAPYRHGRHMEAIADALQLVSAGKIKRLLINIPPRCCKSTLVSVAWPAWDWIETSNRQFFTLSHSDKLAMRDSRRHRQLVESPWYQMQWPLQMMDDQNEKRSFINRNMGRRQSAGLDSGLTGEGGDIIVIDDPIDRDQAESKTELERVCLQFDEKVQTRLNNQNTGAIVIIGQRLAANDLFGHLMKKGGWDVLCLPQEFESDHPVKTTVPNGDWRTKDGELLWPQHIGPPALKTLKDGLTAYAYAGQQQQRPSPREGGMFQRSWFKVVPRFTDVPSKAVRYWDLASLDKDGDFSVGCLVVKFVNDFYVIDVRRGQWNPSERKRQMRLAAESDDQRWPGLRVELWEEREGGSVGVEAADLHVAEFSQWGMRTEKPTGSKTVRAEAVMPQVEHGHVYLVDGPWVARFLDELETFPKGEHDDQVDAFSGALSKILMQKRWVVAG